MSGASPGQAPSTLSHSPIEVVGKCPVVQIGGFAGQRKVQFPAVPVQVPVPGPVQQG